MDRYVTPECAPLGSGICDGFSEDGAPCACSCHVAWDLPLTVEGVRDWHDVLHDVVIHRMVREQMRATAGDLVDGPAPQD